MVNFQIMSDTHIESYFSDYLNVEEFIKPSAEILIIAGDIGRLCRRKQLEHFLKGLSSLFQIILYVPGNHEYYTCEGYREKSMQEVSSELNDIAGKISNLYILDRKSVIIGDVCVAGCTLWSHINIEIPRHIVKIPMMTRQKYNFLNSQDVKYIENMISYCKKEKLKLVVVSHHCPSFKLNLNDKKNGYYKTLYFNNLDKFLTNKNVHTWIFGHIHKNFDLKTSGGTRLVTNQKGKEKDRIADYLLNKVITV